VFVDAIVGKISNLLRIPLPFHCPVDCLHLFTSKLNFMQTNLTNQIIYLRSVLLTSVALIFSLSGNSIFAQNYCANETAFFTENFGAGTSPSSHPDVIASSLTYQLTGELYNEGVYRVINNTQQKPDWHNSPDHTGNANGKMLVINGGETAFYSHIITRPIGFAAGDYSSSIFFMNLNRVNICGSRLLLPNITFIVEYQAFDNTWVPLANSPYKSGNIPMSATPVWIRLGHVFTLPVTGNFTVQNIRITLRDGTSSGCGNDYAIDDIKFATCPSGGPLPVEFYSINARQEGAAIAIQWSTASEINNQYFDIEKSIDGGKNWGKISTINTDGNSTVLKKYNVFDLRPAKGLNYYRIKQVDINGQFKYSDIVYVKVAVERTSVSIINNPVNSVINIDFLSKTNERVLVSLYDITGKLVASDRWTIPDGSSRETLIKATNIQKGMYILNIVDESGTTIYNGKLFKQ